MLSQPTDGRLLTSPLGLSSVRRKSAGAPVYDDGTPGVLVRRFFSFFLSFSLFCGAAQPFQNVPLRVCSKDFDGQTLLSWRMDEIFQVSLRPTSLLI